MNYFKQFKSKGNLNFIFIIVFFLSILVISSNILATKSINLQDDEPLVVRGYDRVKLHYYLSLNNYYNQPGNVNISNEIVTIVYYAHKFNNGTDLKNPYLEAKLYLTSIGDILRFVLAGDENPYREGHYLYGEVLYYDIEILDIQKYSPESSATPQDTFENLDLVFIFFVLSIITIIGISSFMYLKRKNEFEESNKVITESIESRSEKLTEIQQIIQEKRKSQGTEVDKKKSIKRR